tara:strand:+ start:12261 stop:13730 length:1470 start_codon:yes stop_codon:yes gene_type:complete
MNTIETYQILEELEIYIKGKLEKRNNYFWPIIKSWVWRYYLYGNNKQTKKEQISRHFLEYFIIFYNTLSNIFFFNLTKNNSKIKILFITRKVYERKLKNGLFTDRLINPLIKLLENATAPQKIIIDKYFPNNLSQIKHLMPKPGIYYKIYGLVKAYNNKKLDQFIGLILNKLEINNKTNLESIKLDFAFYYSWHKLNNKYLAKFSKLNKIVLLGWYFPEMMGIISSARENNIVSYDLQHGKQGRYQAMYSGWKNIAEIKFYQNMPNYFLNWDDYSKENIYRSDRFRKDHIPLVFFNPETYWDYLSIKEIKFQNYKTCKRLLFIGSIQEGEIEDIMPIENILSLTKNLNSKVSLRIRFHPNTPKSLIRRNQSRINNIKEKFLNIDISISDKNNSFLNELEWCTHLLTFYSTCCLAANKYEKGVCVVGNDAKEIYSEKIDQKRFIWLENLDLKYSKFFSNWLKSSFREREIYDNEEMNTIEIKNKLKLLIK